MELAWNHHVPHPWLTCKPNETFSLSLDTAETISHSLEDIGSAAASSELKTMDASIRQKFVPYTCVILSVSQSDVVPSQCWVLRYLLFLFAPYIPIFMACGDTLPHLDSGQEESGKVVTLPLKGTMRRSYTGFWLTFYVHIWQKVDSKLYLRQTAKILSLWRKRIDISTVNSFATPFQHSISYHY